MRALHDNGVKIELVAPLPGLFLLRGIDIGNARYDLQRIHIMVREFLSKFIFFLFFSTIYCVLNFLFQDGILVHVDYVRCVLRGVIFQH